MKCRRSVSKYFYVLEARDNKAWRKHAAVTSACLSIVSTLHELGNNLQDDMLLADSESYTVSDIDLKLLSDANAYFHTTKIAQGRMANVG